MKITESSLQIAVVDWFIWTYPELARLLVKIPNEGRRSWARGRQMKREGLQKDFPDLVLFIPRGIYHGMVMEVKKLGEKPRAGQAEYLKLLENHGYYATYFDTFEEGQASIIWYLKQQEDRYD